MKKLNIGVIGCGIISDVYLKNLTAGYSTLRAAACADILAEKSRAQAEKYGIESVEADTLLADPGIDVVLNLTTPQFHKDISLAAIQSGKHVYSEKPLAVTLADGREILDAAAARGVRVGCAPDTFLGASIQTAIKAVKDGWIGRPLSAVACFSCRGHERWHTSPDFYYQPGGGPVLDNAPYFLTALAAALGRVKRVNAMAGRGFDRRMIGAGPRQGEFIPVDIDTHVSASLEFENGVIVTSLWSFDIWATHLPAIEIYGSGGTLTLPVPSGFDGPVLLKGMDGADFRELPRLYPHSGNLRGLGLAQMCHAILHGGEHSASGALALHVLEVMCAIEQSAKTGETVACQTDCPIPEQLVPGILEKEYGF